MNQLLATALSMAALCMAAAAAKIIFYLNGVSQLQCSDVFILGFGLKHLSKFGVSAQA